jgi:hypothetical protein
MSKKIGWDKVHCILQDIHVPADSMKKPHMQCVNSQSHYREEYLNKG